MERFAVVLVNMKKFAAIVSCVIVGTLSLLARYLDGLGYDYETAEHWIVWVGVIVYPFCSYYVYVKNVGASLPRRLSVLYISLGFAFMRAGSGGFIFDAGLSSRLNSADFWTLKNDLVLLINDTNSVAQGGISRERLSAFPTIKALDSRINYLITWTCGDPSKRYGSVCFGGGFRQWALVYSTSECMEPRYSFERKRYLGNDIWSISVRK
jgi:hypothetical protein